MQLSTQTLPQTRFAMNRLEFGAPCLEIESLTPPPYEINQDLESYNIFFNMYGIPESNIRLYLDEEKHAFVVYAEREKKDFTDQYMWMFALPMNADIRDLETHYKQGVVQFRFPKFTEWASVV